MNQIFSGKEVDSEIEALPGQPGEPVKAFLPSPLPLEPIPLGHELQEHHDQAIAALARLDGMTTLLPDPALYIYSYVRREAVLSSQIEGTQSSLSDLLLHEAGSVPGVPSDDLQETSLYVRALYQGREAILREKKFSNTLLLDMHRTLLSSGRGSKKNPGEFRRIQNFIVTASRNIFVPPPHQHVDECMACLEDFLNNSRMSILSKAALAHVQFETIHPFRDGNGRTGRLLIPLQLCAEKLLSEPVLYLSFFFKRNRARYYELLQQTREGDNWEKWMSFFLEGVLETALHAIETARRLQRLFSQDKTLIQEKHSSRVAASALAVYDTLCKIPVQNVSQLAERTKFSDAAVRNILGRLEACNIVREMTGRARGRVYAYGQYLDILNEDTEETLK